MPPAHIACASCKPAGGSGFAFSAVVTAEGQPEPGIPALALYRIEPCPADDTHPMTTGIILNSSTARRFAIAVFRELLRQSFRFSQVTP